MAPGINAGLNAAAGPNPAGAPGYMMQNLLYWLDATQLAAITNGPFGQDLVNSVLLTLGAGGGAGAKNLASAINAGGRQFLTDLFDTMDGQAAAEAMNDGQAALQLLKDVLTEMSAANTAAAIQAASPLTGSTVFSGLGLNLHIKSSYLWLLIVPIGNLDTPAKAQVTGAAQGWP